MTTRITPVRAGLTTLALVVGAALTGCEGAAAEPDAGEPANGGTMAAGNGDASEPADGGSIAVVAGGVEITSDNHAFDASAIRAPAGEPFMVTYINAESIPHNFSVYTERGGETIVEGEIITGPDAIDEVSVPALQPGEYYFVCDLHPGMNGTIIVEG